MGRLLTREDFLQRAHKVHEDKYDYTNNMVKQAYTNAKKALRLGSVAAIIRTDAGGQPTFYLAKGGEQRMREYGFELWKNGRGEKKRDYIQDDWI